MIEGYNIGISEETKDTSAAETSETNTLEPNVLELDWNEMSQAVLFVKPGEPPVFEQEYLKGMRNDILTSYDEKTHKMVIKKDKPKTLRFQPINKNSQQLQLMQIEDGRGQINFEYDEIGRVTAITVNDRNDSGEIQFKSKTTFTYESDNSTKYDIQRVEANEE